MEPASPEPSPQDVSGRFDALCLQFEKAWQAEENPCLDDYLDRLPEEERPALLRELQRLEVKLLFGRVEKTAAQDRNSCLPLEQTRIDAIGHEITDSPEADQGDSPTAATPIALRQLGDYRIVREIGQGGMGIVYEAEQVSLGRRVALKILPRQMLLNANARCRFEREAQAAARLHHTNIVPVFAVGDHEGLPYYVMQYIQGMGLDVWIAQCRERTQDKETGRQGDKEIQGESADFSLSPCLPVSLSDHPRQVARIGKQAAEALAYAHRQGIIHRDIKPSNLLLDERGMVWVTDFGLAKADDQQNLTQSGDVLGTLRYMPPEAFEGQLDHRGDIYALGLTLFELLAFQPAFTQSDRARLVMRVTTAEAPRLDSLNPALPRDLVTVIHKCIDRDPARRYQTATALAADLKRFLASEPIHARRISNLERLLRWSRHNRGLASSLAVIALLVLTVAIGASVAAVWFQDSARRNARLADEKEQARQIAELAGEEARRRGDGERWERYRANIAAAASALQMQNVANARNALEAAPREYRNWEWSYFQSQLDSSRLVLDAPFVPSALALSLDGKRVAVSDSTVSRVLVWETATGKRLHALNGGLDAVRVTISPDGSRAAFATKHGAIRLVDLMTGKDTGILDAHKGTVSALAFSPDSKRLASAGVDGTVRLWDVAAARQAAVLTDVGGAVESIELSADGKRMLTVVPKTALRLWDLERKHAVATLAKIESENITIGFSPDSRRVFLGMDYPLSIVRLWDALTGQQFTDLAGHQNRIYGVAFSSDGSRIASASQDQTVRLWDGKTGKTTAILRGHTAWVGFVAFSPDGKRLVSTDDDGTLRVWDAFDGEPIDVLRGHAGSIQGVAWSHDGRQIATIAKDRTLRLWDVQGAAGILRGHGKYVYDVAWRHDGGQLASAAWDGTVRLWDAASGKQTDVLRHENDIVTSVAYSNDGKRLASVSRGDRITIWDLATGKPTHTFKAPTGETLWDMRAVFNPKGTRLAAVTRDGLVRLWNVPSGEPAGSFRADPDCSLDVAFRPDGARLACACRDGTIPIWDAERLQLVTILRGHTKHVNRVVYGKDGRLLASASEDKTARLWDAETERELVAPLVHSNSVYDVSFSLDGTRLATACADNTIRLWDTATGQEVAELRGHRAYVHAVKFSPDGTRLASASGDFTVRVWDTVPNRLRARAAIEPGR